MKQPVWTNLRAKYLNTDRKKIAGIVLHDTAGNGTHGDTLYLANPGDGRRVSVDFTVERDGKIFKLNPDLEKFYTSHASRATRFKGQRNNGVGRMTLGIEICQHHKLALTPIWPQAQVKSVAVLCAWLVNEFKLTTSDITTHRNIITDGSRSDPRQFPFDGGEGFWQYYWEAMGKGKEYEAADTITKIPDAEKRSYTVKKGDTLSGIAAKLLKKAGRWPEIQKLNSLSGTTILPGQVLLIPEK